MNEFEQKIMLQEAEYEQLMMLLRHSGNSTTQTNYYFDTDDFAMNRHHMTCRIRLKEGKCQATMKIHIPNSDHSIEIDVPTPDSIHDHAFTAIGLNLQGELKTERTQLFKTNEFEIVMDKNTYLGVVDYELEIEYIAQGCHNTNDPLKRVSDRLHHEIENELFIHYDHDAAEYLQYLMNILTEHIQPLHRINGSPRPQKNKSQRFFERKIFERSQ